MKATVSVDRPATVRQIEYLTSLAKQVGHPVPDHVDLTTWTTAQASEMIDRLKSQLPTGSAKLATDRQVEYIRGLLAERETPEGIDASMDMDGLTAENASALIRSLKVAPRRAASPANAFENVPDGHYAIDAREGHTIFLRVYTFRNGNRGVSLQSSDEYHAMPSTVVPGYLERIEADLEGALARYGHEIGRCGICNRILTNEESRERGIGPKCAAKAGL